MVLLTVKGTKHADEFTYECSVKDLAEVICPKVVHIQNKRLSVRNQVSSFAELLPSAKLAVAMEGRPADDLALVPRLEELLATIDRDMKNARAAVPDDRYDAYWTALRDLAVAIFPNECTNKDDKEEGVYEAAIVALYHLYDNPEIDEDYRLMVYHCRCIMDPLWRVHDMLDEKKGAIALWFNGKELAKDSAVGTLCANNDKSRITVKVAYAGGAAPSLEPRIAYDQQRELRQMFMAKADERKQLEESEMHGLIRRQYAANPGLAIGAIARASGVAASSNGPTPSIKCGKISETIVEGN